MPITENENNNANHETILITLHRGQVFNELIELFKNMPTEFCLEIEMILPNGKKENGFDLGGVYRDCLSESWDSFYEKCTLGSQYKIPYVRHDFKEADWGAVAKVLKKDYRDVNYFPLKIAPSFMEQCIYGKTEKELFQSFANYVNARDSEVIENALKDFSAVDQSELIDILETIECKWIPTSTNFNQLIQDIAHKELIQKPMFVIDCWREILGSLVTSEELQRIYEKNIPLPKNILPLIESSEENVVLSYLRESKDETEDFLRFCTGANMLTGNKIKINFNSVEGIQKNPVGHTCSCTLELSRNYENYPTFRAEMNEILSSKIWVMDII